MLARAARASLLPAVHGSRFASVVSQAWLSTGPSSDGTCFCHFSLCVTNRNPTDSRAFYQEKYRAKLAEAERTRQAQRFAFCRSFPFY